MYMTSEPIVWTAKVRKVEELKNFERNPRKIDETSFKRLVDRIQTRGFHDVIKLDTDDNILSGNQRKRALSQLGIKTVNTLTPSRPLTDEETRAIVVESNRSDGFFDFEILAADYSPEELIKLGFSERELDMVEFPELDNVNFTEEVDNEQEFTFEIILSSEEDYAAFTKALKKIQKELYPESTTSIALLKYLKENVK